MTHTIAAAFAKGLTAGFAGKSVFEKIKRGPFDIFSSSVNEGGVSYIDQWIAADHMGGGQEILETGGKRYTRVYTGGHVHDEQLEALGITSDDILGCLKRSLLAAGAATRFDASFFLEDGRWKYQYIPDKPDETTGMMSGKETIYYDGTPVSVHLFLIASDIE